MSFAEFGFGAGDDNLGSKSKRFKGKEGEQYRVSFVWWPGMEDGTPDLNAKTPKFIGCKRAYLQGVGYFISHGPEWDKLAGQPSKMQVATLICKWPTDSKGQLDKGRFQNGDFEVMPWIMSIDKYRNIEQNHNEFPLGQHDLNLTCTDTQYQKITISPCRENLLRKMWEKDPSAEIVQKLITATKAAIASVANELAQDLTIAQIHERLGRGGNTGGGGGGAGGTGTGVKSVDLDNMLEDILG